MRHMGLWNRAVQSAFATAKVWTIVFPCSVSAVLAADTPAPLTRLVAGQLVSVSGKVTAQSDSSAERPLNQVGQDVYVGDAIKTLAGGQVKLLMKDQSILDLGDSTRVRVAEFTHPNDPDRSVRIDLDYGQLRGAVTRKLQERSKFVIRTKTATMGVRGTELIVKASDKTELTVLQGKVAVQPSGLGIKAGSAPPFPTYVSAGRQIVVQTVPQQTNVFVPPPSVTTLQPQRIAEIAQSVKVEDTVLRGALSSEVHQTANAVATETTSISRSPAATPPTNPVTLAGTLQGSLGGPLGSGPPVINPRAGTNPTVTVTVIHP